MKKLLEVLTIIILSGIVCILGYKKDITKIPNYYYQVYLDDEVLGVIKDKNALEKYIDTKGKNIKEEYEVDKVYAPNGLQIKRILTYNDKLDSVESVYRKLTKLKPFTIKGYRFTIKRTNEEGKIEQKYVYTTSKEIFKEAIDNTMKTYIGVDEYEAYASDSQDQITTTGVYIDNVYIQEEILVKELRIPVTEEIFIDTIKLSKYLLFGSTEEQKKYIVKTGDTLEKIAEDNKMGVEALLISNSSLTSKDNLLYTGQELSLAEPNSLVFVVAEYTNVEDREVKYSIQEVYDSSMNIGDEYVSQQGMDGISRVTSIIRKINGEITYAQNTKTVELEPAINRIIMVGTNRVSTVGSLNWWKWPTQPGYSISSGYGYRYHPTQGKSSFHQALDIYVGYGTAIYAANNGVVTTAAYSPARVSGGNGYGYYIVINHNNGYYTLYAHLSGFVKGLKVGSTVSRGQLIGYMGKSGDATGPHLHFELWRGYAPWQSGLTGNINPYYAPGGYR